MNFADKIKLVNKIISAFHNNGGIVYGDYVKYIIIPDMIGSHTLRFIPDVNIYVENLFEIGGILSTFKQEKGNEELKWCSQGKSKEYILGCSYKEFHFNIIFSPSPTDKDLFYKGLKISDISHTSFKLSIDYEKMFHHCYDLLYDIFLINGCGIINNNVTDKFLEFIEKHDLESFTNINDSICVRIKTNNIKNKKTQSFNDADMMIIFDMGLKVLSNNFDNKCINNQENDKFRKIFQLGLNECRDEFEKLLKDI
jgi:hypothetical protein